MIWVANEVIFDRLQMAQFLSRFRAGELSLENPTFVFSVGREPAHVCGDLYAQIFTEFSYFYSKLYFNTSKVTT